jgi:hypothetical protein
MSTHADQGTDMAHLHLPAQHSDDDLAIAGALAQILHSEELYVAWSSAGAGEPVIPARLHTPETLPAPPAPPAPSHAPRRGLLGRLLDSWRRTA